jgi:phosphonopyruvate decarboxylase
MSRDAALEALARRRRDEVVVATMTALGPWQRRSPHARNLACIGFMGGASALGLGVALARPGLPVWVLDGDGSLLMQLGSLATIAGAAPARFLHVVVNNGVYETSGGQAIPAADRVSFAGLAAAAGYARAERFDDVEAFDAALDGLLAADGPVLAELLVQPGASFYQPPPPTVEPPPPAFAGNWRRVREALRGG